MAWRRPALAVLLLVFLAGCGMFGKKDPESDPMELQDIDASVRVERLWSNKVGRGPGRAGAGLRPAHADGRLWVADRRGLIEVLDERSGNVERRIDVDLRLSAGPAVFDDYLAVGTINGQAVLIERGSGEVLWRAQLSSEILAPPLLRDGILVVRCIDGRVFGLDIETGFRQWVYDRSVPLLTLRGNSPPLARGGQVFIGHDDGAVTALDVAEGSLLWEQRISSPEGRTELDRLADIDGPMAVVGLDLFAVTRHGRMASIALDSGRVLWVKDLASYSGVSVSRTELAVTDLRDRVYLLDRRSGSTQWTQDNLLRRGLTRPVFMGDVLAVADREGYIHWLSSDSGEFVARERASRDATAGAPLVVGNVLYLMDVEGKVTAWRVGAGD